MRMIGKHVTEPPGGDKTDNLPSVAFIVLAGEDADKLIGCLETIARQEYPEKLVRTIFVGSRSRGGEVDVARRFGAAVMTCAQEDVSARISLGIGNTNSDIVFVIGADSGLSRTDWIRLMIRPFIERAEVAGVFTQMVEVPSEGAFARYLCRINGDLFAWFVHGDNANPRHCRGINKAAGSGEGYVIHSYHATRPPFIPADHGVGVRRSALPGAGGGNGTEVPLVQLVESGQSVAFVPVAGIHHQNADGLWGFVKECHMLLRASPDGWPVCAEQHPSHRSRWRRIRKHFFVIYGLTVVMPLIDGMWLSVLEKNACMLWHGPAAIFMSWLMLIERARRLVAGGPPGKQ